jgi:prefoldin subunit 5
VNLTLKTYAYLKNEIQIISNEISLLYKRQDELNKQIQELCLHENKITLTNVEYSGMLQDVDYCNDCKKTMLLS